MKQDIKQEQINEKDMSPENQQALLSELCGDRFIVACECCEDSSDYFEVDGSMCYDASCGCINFR